MLTQELVKQFIIYKKFLLYYPNTFGEVVTNEMESFSFGRSCYSNIMYTHKNKNKSPEVLKANILEKIKHKNFDFYKTINSNIIITNNDFPYILPPKYKSYIIWDLNDTPISQINIMLTNFVEHNQYIIWKNKKSNQSIKSLSHYHLVIREPICKLKLKQIIVVVRHGPRQPIMIPCKFNKGVWNIDPNISYKDQIRKAALTPIGKSYCEFRGKELLDGYSSSFDFNSLIKNDILLESSFYDRTMESTIHFLAGCNININLQDIKQEDCLASDKSFSPEQKVIYEEIINNFLLPLDTKLFDNLIEKVTGFTVTGPKDYFDIHSTINCYKVHGYDLPDNIYLIDEKLEKLATLYYNLFNSSDNIYPNILASKLFIHINQIMNSDKKFAYLSTHDNILMPLIKYIVNKYNIRDKYIEMPDFCSSIRFEVWESVKSDEITKYIRIYYDTLLIIEIKE
jgi:hypothetical protein